MADKYDNISEDIVLGVGEKIKIKFGFMDSMTIIYGGMVSKDVFSLALLFGSGYQGYSYNLYYLADSRNVKIGRATLSIVSVKTISVIIVSPSLQISKRGKRPSSIVIVTSEGSLWVLSPDVEGMSNNNIQLIINTTIFFIYYSH